MSEPIALRVNGEIRDLNHESQETETLIEPVFWSDPEALSLIRHDCAHVMAEAVQTLFPETQVTIGPAIANGFYYDFAREEPFSPEDLPKIEQKMREIIKQNHPFTREVWERARAIDYFKEKKEFYKVALIEDIAEDQPLTIYRQGEWLDLCRGPHMPSTGWIGAAFRLTALSGAYWRGDVRNPMLRRIYGTVWRTQEELKAHLHQLEEAKRRDHRLLGRQIDLFHFQEEGKGSAFWHPRGWILWRLIEEYIRSRLEQAGYQEVKTPQLLSQTLWEKSGHWEKFRDNMFTLTIEDGKIFALKPMNCPGHIQIFRQGSKSYRHLPLRMAEFGSCHRQEPSGSLQGLMRVRAFTQDDAHIFCTQEQILEESVAFCRLLESVYADFGFERISVKFSDRPDIRIGSQETWDRAEDALKRALEATGLPYTLNPGEGAFYGPKLEFILRDAIGREWQCGTLQVDFVLAERLGATYIDQHNQPQPPVLLHRAILGSLERFIGILLEHYAGWLPLWLTPTQGVVATLTNDVQKYAQEVYTGLRACGLRVEQDYRNEKINLKIREHTLRKVPLILIIGRNEAQNTSVSLRWHNAPQQTLSFEDARKLLLDRARPPNRNREE